MLYRNIALFLTAVGISLSMLVFTPSPASARGMGQDSPWICVQRTDYDHDQDSHHAFQVYGTNEIWIIDPLAEETIANTFGFFPEAGEYAVLRDPTLYYEDDLLILFGVYRFMEISDCEPDYFINLDDEVIDLGQCTTVHWWAEVPNVTLDGGDVESTGDKRVCPTETSTYTLRVNTDWWSAEQSVILEVRKPEPIIPDSAAAVLDDDQPVSDPSASLDPDAIPPEAETCGYAAIFHNPDQAIWQGHVAFAIADKTGGRMFWGSVDGVRDCSTCAWGDAKVWVTPSNTFDLDTIWADMARRGYKDVKYIELDEPNCDYETAYAKAQALNNWQYEVLGRNCANATWDVLKAFGVPLLMPLQVYPQPNQWYMTVGADAIFGRKWRVEVLESEKPSSDETDQAEPSLDQSLTEEVNELLQPQGELVTDFDHWGSWKIGDQPYGSFTQASDTTYKGKSGKLEYDLPAGGDSFVLFRQLRAIPGEPREFHLWVYGDGSDNFLNLWIQDNKGVVWQLSFGRIGHTGWREMTAPIEVNLDWPVQKIAGTDASDITFPIQFYALVLDGVPDDTPQTGVIYVDELTVQ